MSASATATELYRQINDVQLHLTAAQNGLIAVRARLAALDILDNPKQPERHRTGWRFVRGTHSGSYIRDPEGTDRLPAGHQQ